ncbi:MAG: Na+/H+ antiporter subunit B [Oleiphilaceae bacterium]|nr:Na+/H+ antiporter subunit B [Oleiphilaceae bacterium]
MVGNSTSNTLILRTAATFLVPLQMLFSVFLLLRGHDEPGGGFIAGLVATAAVVLYLFAYGVARTRLLMRVDPRDLLSTGLILALISTVPGVFLDQPFMTSLWYELVVPGVGKLKLSTPLLFDIGVYFTVMGSILTMVVALTESEGEK